MRYTTTHQQSQQRWISEVLLEVRERLQTGDAVQAAKETHARHSALHPRRTAMSTEDSHCGGKVAQKAGAQRAIEARELHRGSGGVHRAARTYARARHARARRGGRVGCVCEVVV